MTVLGLSAVALAGGLFFAVARPSGAQQGGGLVAEPPSPELLAKKAELEEKHAVQRLRETLGLGTAELAAMGLTEEQAVNILQTAKSWSQQNADRLEAARRQVDTAQRALAVIDRRIAVGPRDTAVINDRSDAAEALDAARDAHQAILTELDAAVLTRLTPSQQSTYAAARFNAGFVPSGTVPDAATLSRSNALRVLLRGGGDGDVISTQVDELRANLTASLDGVVAAEHRVASGVEE